MDSFKSTLKDAFESDYLHYQHEKFWEIRVFIGSKKTLIRCGGLTSDDKEKDSSVQMLEKRYSSEDDARHAVKRLIDMKLSKGYKYLDKSKKTSHTGQIHEAETIEEEKSPFEMLKRGPSRIIEEDKVTKQIKAEKPQSLENKSQVKDQYSQKTDELNSIRITSGLMRRGPEIEKYGSSLGLICRINKDKVIVFGQDEQVDKLRAYIMAMEDGDANGEKSCHQDTQKTDDNEFIEKDMDLTGNLNNHKVLIENKLKELGLFYEFRNNKIHVFGAKKVIVEMTNYLSSLDQGDSSSKTSKTNSMLTHNQEELYNSNNDSIQGASKPSLELATPIKINESEQDFEQKQITLLPVHKEKIEQIQAKARELDLICDFESNIVLVAGAPSNILKFEKALSDIEESSKKMFYSVYWDFSEKRLFAKIMLDQNSLEYQGMLGGFFRGIREVIAPPVIYRIQDKRLMELYIDNCQKRMRQRPHPDRCHMLLFNSDPLAFNSLGVDYESLPVPPEGIKFSQMPTKFTSRGLCTQFVYNVYVGASVNDRGSGTHLPDGYDSVKSGPFFVIYDRLQSYPLYQIDYMRV